MGSVRISKNILVYQVSGMQQSVYQSYLGNYIVQRILYVFREAQRSARISDTSHVHDCVLDASPNIITIFPSMLSSTHPHVRTAHSPSWKLRGIDRPLAILDHAPHIRESSQLPWVD